jgi:hypothetical protein
MNISSSSQNPPDREVVWVLEYYDVNGNPIIEEISLK